MTTNLPDTDSLSLKSGNIPFAFDSSTCAGILDSAGKLCLASVPLTEPIQTKHTFFGYPILSPEPAKP